MSSTELDGPIKAEFSTAICFEQANTQNPFLAQARFIRGYRDRELWQTKSFIEVLLLHFLGELPDPKQTQVLETLFVGLMNLGPRDTGTRAAMVAGISKTRPEHLLPIGLLAIQGTKNGSSEVEAAHEFIRSHMAIEPRAWVAQQLPEASSAAQQPYPGFGAVYGDIDPILTLLAQDIFALVPDSNVFQWCQNFVVELRSLNQGWLVSGLVAAVCLELGVAKRESIAIFQLARSVGIAAHGMEQSHQPLTHAPMLGDDHYELL